MSRVLVTGAAGFIGSHLVDRLLEMGHEVTGVNCFTDYYPEGRMEHFVLASSSSIYGSDNGRPVDEDAPKRPVYPYGMSKLAAEELVELYGRERGVPTTVLRYFTVYGPRQRPEMALSRFISLALSGEPVEVFCDGTQTREMTYVSDVADATAAALEARPAIEPRAYNVGGGARTR